MIQGKYELPNGNIFIWLGRQKIYDCENVLILAGGDVLFLKEVEILTENEIREDIKALSKEQFFIKRKWKGNSSTDDLYWELKELVK